MDVIHISLFLFVVLSSFSCSTSPILSKSHLTENIGTNQKHNVVFGSSTLLFDLPSDKWVLVDEREADKITLHLYVREGIVDSAGRNVKPTFAIIRERVASKQDLTVYSMLKRIERPFHIDKIFTHEDGFIKIEYALGYNWHL